MVIAVCTVQLELFAHSLKDKRSVVKPILSRVRDRFNVSAAEVDDHDLWGQTTLAFVCVSTEAAYANGLLTRVVEYIEQSHLDANLLGYHIELL